MNYGNLAQTGAVVGATAGIASGSWLAVGAVASVVFVTALYNLVRPSAKARP